MWRRRCVKHRVQCRIVGRRYIHEVNAAVNQFKDIFLLILVELLWNWFLKLPSDKNDLQKKNDEVINRKQVHQPCLLLIKDKTIDRYFPC